MKLSLAVSTAKTDVFVKAGEGIEVVSVMAALEMVSMAFGGKYSVSALLLSRTN